MEEGHNIRRTETPDDVPRQKIEGDFPVEKASINWIENALNHRGFVSAEANSRENSLSITKLDEALMWAERDLKNKIKAKEAEEAEEYSESREDDEEVEEDEVG